MKSLNQMNITAIIKYLPLNKVEYIPLFNTSNKTERGPL